ncbi:MAG: hypothetical protein ACTSV1_00110 [Alphaproteobacteria bacterium]
MLGFSIQKLLFTAVAIFLVWQGFKWYTRSQQVKAERKANMPPNSSATGGSSGGPKTATAQEMVKCDVCDTYIPSDTKISCGRDGCPYP